MKTWSKVSLLLFTLVFVLTACSPVGGTTSPEVMMTEMPEMDIPQTGGELDEMFINMMVPHHEGAVEMARIALERAEHPEVLAMADEIVTAQEAEIQQMKAWKLEWYGTSDTPSMSEMPSMHDMPDMGAAGHGMDMQAEVDALRAAPEPFDLAFIDAMILHHQSAIDAAQLVINAAVHEEIRTLAEDIIEAQQSEIDQMLAWRADWYPDAPAVTP